MQPTHLPKPARTKTKTWTEAPPTCQVTPGPRHSQIRALVAKPAPGRKHGCGHGKSSTAGGNGGDSGQERRTHGRHNYDHTPRAGYGYQAGR